MTHNAEEYIRAYELAWSKHYVEVLEDRRYPSIEEATGWATMEWEADATAEEWAGRQLQFCGTTEAALEDWILTTSDDPSEFDRAVEWLLRTLLAEEEAAR